MLMLAVDQSTHSGSAALFEGDDCIASTAWEAGGHDRGLFAAVPELLRRHRLEASAIDACVVGLGPGSFTGIRISLAYATGLAQPDNKPVTGIGSAAVMALDIPADATDGDVAIVGDARRGLIWIARFIPGDPCRRLQGEILLRPQAEAADALRGVTRIGSADTERLAELAAELDLQPVCPSARALGRLALARQAAGIPTEPLTPLYLHPPVAG